MRRPGARGWAACTACVLLVGCGDGAVGSREPEDAGDPPASAAAAPGPDAATAAGPSPDTRTDGAPALPAAPEVVHDAAWSPDGERLAVTWDRGRGARLHGLVAGTDSTPRAAARGLPLSRGRGAWASWSPDGFWIAYEAGGDVHRMRPDGTGDEPLVTGAGTQSHPAWAPDGARLALVEEGPDGSALRVVRLDGGEVASVPAPGGGRWRAPVWTPSGDGLVVELSLPGRSVLHAVAAGGGTPRELVPGSDPAFGPDGSLWWARDDSVFRAEWADGSPVGARAVVVPGRAPAPAPDGIRVAFVRDGADGPALWALDLETAEERRLTAAPAGPDFRSSPREPRP